MHWKTICGGALCFAAGGMTGVLLSSSPVRNGGRTASGGNPVDTPPTERMVSSWRRSNAGSGGHESQSPSGVEESSQQEIPEEEKIGVPVALLEAMSKSKATRTIDQPILDDRDPVEAVLGLTKTEKDRIQLRWNQAREEILKLETQALTANDLEDGSVQLKLPDMSKERGRLAEKFMGSLTDTLGRDRGEAFYAVKQIGGMFAADSGERSINVKVESVGKDRWGYRMTLEDASGKRVWVGDRIPRELGHLADAAKIFPTINEVVRAAEGE